MKIKFPRTFLCIEIVLLTVAVGNLSAQSGKARKTPKKYYFSPSGKDSNTGIVSSPWQHISRISTLHLQSGDTVMLEGGKTFKGSILVDSPGTDNSRQPIFIGSYGSLPAVIDAGTQTGISIRKTNHIVLRRLILKGAGRKKGNTGRGIWVSASDNIIVQDIEVSGFQKSGVEITDCRDVHLERINAHDNGYAGIAVTGNHFPEFTNRNIYIGHCITANNPGDPTELNNHSGNGIVVGLARNVLIEYCTATNNGWDMPRQGNGPVGIWAWEADSVTIQSCLSYRNRTAPGAADGGGFDLDGGVTHSIVQYNLSYENEGYGFGIFQFSGASPWYDNIFRYNISYNDGNKTVNGASVLWWNGSRDSSQFHDCYFYQNLLYNSKGYALGVVPNEYQSSRFFFLNNILVAKDEMMSGGPIGSEKFFGNAWWSILSKFKFNGMTDFKTWTQKPGMENLGGLLTGININPLPEDPITPAITRTSSLHSVTGMALKKNSPLRDKGLDLHNYFQLNTGGRDFLGNKSPQGNAPEPGAIELR
jgi:hypothetical protein